MKRLFRFSDKFRRLRDITKLTGYEAGNDQRQNHQFEQSHEKLAGITDEHYRIVAKCQGTQAKSWCYMKEKRIYKIQRKEY